jgi:DNA-binding transcriptional LysR family regulator
VTIPSRPGSQQALDLLELRTFLAVVSERGFSKAGARLHRTQSAVSYAVRRLERQIGERLFDRSSNNGLLTEAGELLRNYAERLIRLSNEAQASVRELRELRRGRVLIGANEAAIPILMPIVATFRAVHPQVLVDVRRVHARDLVSELVQGNLDFGVTTFLPSVPGLRSLPLARDEMMAVVYPGHRFATRSKLSIVEWAKEPIIVHNESTLARERVLQLAESRGAPVNVQMALPTLDAIKLAVSMELGISMMPRRVALAEIKRGQLVAVPVPEVRRPHPVRLLYRHTSQRSHAASAFLKVARQ